MHLHNSLQVSASPFKLSKWLNILSPEAAEFYSNQMNIGIPFSWCGFCRSFQTSDIWYSQLVKLLGQCASFHQCHILPIPLSSLKTFVFSVQPKIMTIVIHFKDPYHILQFVHVRPEYLILWCIIHVIEVCLISYSELYFCCFPCILVQQTSIYSQYKNSQIEKIW